MSGLVQVDPDVHEALKAEKAKLEQSLADMERTKDGLEKIKADLSRAKGVVEKERDDASNMKSKALAQVIRGFSPS